jgi:hypothetical protein
VELSEARTLLQNMVELEMRERGERDPRQMVGERVTVSGEAAAGIPMGVEYDAVVSSSLSRLVAGGQLIYDPEQSVHRPDRGRRFRGLRGDGVGHPVAAGTGDARLGGTSRPGGDRQGQRPRPGAARLGPQQDEGRGAPMARGPRVLRPKTSS